MNGPLVCLTLTGRTLEEDLSLVKKYEKLIDVVELRADLLNEDEQLYVKRFPALIYHPCILSIRRDIDGGKYSSGEFSRTNLFGRAMAFANTNTSRNFAYVDFESDYHIPSIQDAAQAFGIKIIRSHYSISEPVTNLRQLCDSMRKTGFEIPKICFMPDSLSDVISLFKESAQINSYDHIIYAMGAEGFPSRILSGITHSMITYVYPESSISQKNENFLVDPIKIHQSYNFRNITDHTKIFAETGWPLNKPAAPAFFNDAFSKHNMNSVYIPIKSNMVSESINFCEQTGIKYLSVSKPFKETVLFYLSGKSPEVEQIGSCNAIISRQNKWFGYNTDIHGFKYALLDFLGPDTKIKKKKVSIIGAGGAAKAAAYVLKQLGAKVCIFNRSLPHAQQIANKYGFEFSLLDAHSVQKLGEYSYLIVQATSVGSDSDTISNMQNDPVYFYNFRGHELVFDLNYTQNITPVMKRAQNAGCRVCNGYKMMEYQFKLQFKLFTDVDYDFPEENPAEAVKEILKNQIKKDKKNGTFTS